MTTARALIILQARMGSTRLPGKVLTDLCGLTLLQRCVHRLHASQVGPVVVATTTRPEDDRVASDAADAGARIVRGSSEDVLARFALAAESWQGAFVIRATADNPLVDIDACRRVLEHLEQGADYVLEKGLPVGTAVEGLTTAALRDAARRATSPYDREHVTPWVRRGGEGLVVRDPPAPESLRRSDLSFTVDTPADLDYVRDVVTRAGVDAGLPVASYIRAADGLDHRHEPGAHR